MRKILALLMITVLVFACLTACRSNEEEPQEEPASDGELLAPRLVEIHIKDYGTVKLELDPNQAPLTVNNFVDLAAEGFYDGLTFHRIIDGFMIQGGADPAAQLEPIPGEFIENGYNNEISHTEGVISMARTSEPNSATSQFFITVADSTFLDGKYAAFGYVTEGLDICKKIAKDAKPVDDNGTILPDQQPVIESIEVVD